MSCLVPAAQADGSTVTTVEGLARPGDDAREGLHPLQEAFVAEFAVQCGFCIPGFLVAGASLLDETGEPSDEQIRLGLAGNLCRCTGYYPITHAVRVAGGRSGTGAPS
jgi:aerobic-type carbon monoxide dehydrogenase small subunit (CoxS/CutS family)